jgi:hypothetical protein
MVKIPNIKELHFFVKFDAMQSMGILAVLLEDKA